MAHGIIQVPPDSTGKKIDAASLDVGSNSIIRQRFILADNSATAQFATITNSALLVTGNFSGTSVVILGAGTNNFGTLNDISATVVVAYASPPTLNSISKTVAVTCSTPFTINDISATVVVSTSTPWIVNLPSASHGPKMLQLSTSATATLITAPGAGNFVYVTSLAVFNGGTVNTSARVGSSASPDNVVAFLTSLGGQFVMNFDPPWKLQSNEAVQCRVDPNTSGNCYFNVNFFVAGS